jgi:hypothetical protein
MRSRKSVSARVNSGAGDSHPMRGADAGLQKIGDLARVGVGEFRDHDESGGAELGETLGGGLLRHKQVLRLRELESMLGDDLREAAVFGGTVAGE